MWQNILKIWKSNNMLKQAWERSFEMLKIDNEMFLEATKSLRESEDFEIREKILAKDKIINKYEREVRKKVLTHCSISGTANLPEGLVLSSIVINIERIGDYTKNIAELAEYHPKTLVGGKFEDELKKIETAVKDNFIRTRNYIKTSDVKAAENLLDEYYWVNKACNKCIKGIVKEKDRNITPGDAASLALYFRWLKRINSHLRNITSSIVNPFHRIGFRPKK